MYGFTSFITRVEPMRPELHRLEGELTLLRDAEAFDKAEASFLRAWRRPGASRRSPWNCGRR